MANIWNTGGVSIDLDKGTRTYGDGSVEKIGPGEMHMLRLRMGQAQTGGNVDQARGTILDNGAGMGPLGATARPAGSSQEVVGGSPVSSGPGAAGPGAGAAGGQSPAGHNPYLSQMAAQLASTMTGNFNRSVMPQIGSQALAAGGYGGSRQGVIEANAINDLNAQIGGALTNLYGQGYNTTLNYDLGLRNNALGYGNLGLGYANLDRNINNDNISNQMMGVNLGLNIWDRLNANNNAAIGAGNNIQNTPLNYWQQFSQGANSIGQGYGTQTSSGGGQGNPVLGALGGAQLGSQLSNWWSGGGNNNWNSMPNSNVFMGNGSMGD